MKILIYVLMILAAALYVAESQSLGETLVRRAEEILKRAKADLERLHGAGRGELVAEIQHQIKIVEELEKWMKTLPRETILELHELHQIEEKLLEHENKLAEEVKRLEDYNQNAPHQRHELEARAREVLSRAFHVLEALHHSGRAHLVEGIEHEIVLIEELIYELRIHPSSTLEGEHGHRIELRLAQHIKRLDEELNQTAS